MNNNLELLPYSLEERESILIQKYPNASLSIIDLIIENYMFAYTVNQPVYLYSYIEDGQLKNKSMMCSIYTSIPKRIENHIFCIYTINKSEIRGSYITDSNGYLSIIRENKINEIIN